MFTDILIAETFVADMFVEETFEAVIAPVAVIELTEIEGVPVRPDADVALVAFPAKVGAVIVPLE